jgi:hypothetical protein
MSVLLNYKLCLSAIVCQIVCFGVPCIIAAHSHLLRSLPFGVVGSCGFYFNKGIYFLYIPCQQESFLALTLINKI